MNLKLFSVIVLSIIISMVVIFHSYNFLIIYYIGEDKLLLLLVILVIELLFITFPYFTKSKSKYDKFLLFGLFLLSCIPASLKTSDTFRKDILQKIIQKPITINENKLILQNQKELDNITIQINSNLQIAKSFTEKNFLTKADRVLRRNEFLSKEKSNITKQIRSLIKENKKSNQKIEKFEIDKKKITFNLFFDFFKLSWTILLITILQLVNGRLVFYGSLMFKVPKNTSVINKNKDPMELLEIYSIRGLGEKTLAKFYEIFEITSLELLVKFINKKDYVNLIQDEFRDKTSKKIIKFCKQIKRSNEKE